MMHGFLLPFISFYIKDGDMAGKLLQDNKKRGNRTPMLRWKCVLEVRSTSCVRLTQVL